MAGALLITGGAGFIGSNLAAYYLARGWRVRILDNLSRDRVAYNVDWLREQSRGMLEVVVGDVRSDAVVEGAVAGVDRIYHLAAQVAVTQSIADPRADFDVNAGGTLNVLEAARRSARSPLLIFTSTNKVYGALAGDDAQDVAKGVTEEQPLDFYSPYGCSKGVADQYVRDYARIYGLRSVVFRMSCIYGPRQFGTEDQGWIAHLIIAASCGRPITLYGDGRQARDILYVSDLAEAFERAAASIDRTAGQIYNIGGGPTRLLSVLELVQRLKHLTGCEPNVNHQPPRPGDQRLYVSGIGKAERDFGWTPSVSVDAGLDRMREWIDASRSLLTAAPMSLTPSGD